MNLITTTTALRGTLMRKLLLMLALVLGVFALTQKAQAQHHPGYYEREYVTCESHGYRYNECQTYRINRIEEVRVVQQHSHTYCQYRRNWGVANPWTIWVDQGCSATFEVGGWSK
jgi:hypothetical protein